jgi:hypothetical protein
MGNEASPDLGAIDLYPASIAGAPTLKYTGKTVTILKAQEPPEYYNRLLTTIRSSVNAQVGEASYEEIEKTLDPKTTDLLIIPNAGSVSHELLKTIDGFLRAGGRLLTLGGPPFNNMEKMPGGIAPEPPTMIAEGIGPEYKFYPITNGAEAVAFKNQVFVASRKYNLAGTPVSVHPRAQGVGYGNMRDFRFVPLIEIYSDKGFRSGFMAWMFIKSTARNNKYPYNGGVVAGFGANDATFYDANGLAAVLDVTRAMLGDCFLSEGGAKEHIYVDYKTDSIKIGAQLACIKADGYTVDIQLACNGKIVAQSEYSAANLSASQIPGFTLLDVSFDHDVKRGKPDAVVVSLKKEGQTVDRIVHEVEFWNPVPEKDRKFVTIADNEFMLDGKPVRFFGVNFVPSSGNGFNLEHAHSLFRYVIEASYDPDVYYKDLVQVKDVGFNAVSLFIFHPDNLNSNSMLHLIRMCEKLGLYVDLSIRPNADPFDFNDKQVIDMIQSLHLPELTNLYAYDIAWERTWGNYEPSYGNAAGRKSYDRLWERWVINNYGSIENAEKESGYKIPRKEENAVTSPADVLYNTDGEHTKMMAGYRRFTDDLVAERHSYACDLIRQYDPNHLVSARTISTSGIPMWTPGFDTGFDFASLNTAFDFLSPECWGMLADTAEQGIFTHFYARYVKPGAPVVWKEFGEHIWTGSNFNDTTERQKSQADYHMAIFDMAIAGGARGLFSWFWPGGYRPGENSDFGVLNPDGSDRLVTKVIRDYSKKFLNQPRLGTPDTFFVVDRDKSATGTNKMYETIKDDMLAAVKAGRIVAFKDESTGTTTATVPDTGVGGGKAGSTVPARFVNGHFRAVYVKLADGNWKRIKYGDSVQLPAGPVVIKAVMSNSKGAEWLSRSQSSTSYVSLISTDRSEIRFNLPLSENVKQIGTHTQEFKLCDTFSGNTDISFRFNIEGRFPFGSPFMFTVVPE